MRFRVSTRRVPAVAAFLATAALTCVPIPAANAEQPAAEQVASEKQAADIKRVEKEKALEALRRDIESQHAAEAALAAEIETLRKDRVALNEQLIETAARVQDIEASIDAVEDRIDELEQREDELRASFRARSGLLSELLGALQRMGRRPPPAVLVEPSDALKTVRTAILLGAVLPGVRIETEALAWDLEEMGRLKRQIDAEKARLLARSRDLAGERRRIAALVEAKRESVAKGEEELGSIREKAKELAAEARNLEELIASIDREIAVARREREAAARPRATPEQARGALRDPARLEPAIAFSQAVGLLPKPVTGAVTRDFGTPDEIGSPARGISIATRARAQVTAPSDGWVVYAGPFRSYGQLLILNAGDGYHVLLAGMETIAVDLGQFVLTGEPVGQMAGLLMASAESITVGRSQPVLYVEFRKDGHPIDPAPWWAKGRTGAGG
ncbi:murein hydrolase activator EnvC family protein [Microbaculum marinisediminis]|uniref:Peptidoglycan DD-metalloendopeptidase family protein n=1 Tax=Microbaculum marinisediminis TaxID=2931392 RepID=A0AAW5R182_9HYPH|nr:peptidoglycan DD-metalloendopeptidase family protein [Microbaculum sp. A6E488]MCT8972466.1 peptidoglycan DD-metalloendopeptidase family protein [Microbaculum sp. A6E488]